MDVIYVAISLSGALLALTLAVVSLVLHYIRRAETPEYTALSAQIRALDAELVDMMDKVKHWRNRDQVRNTRARAEEKLADEPVHDTSPASRKAHLRAKATAAGLGIVGR